MYLLDTDTLSNLTKRRPSTRLLRRLEAVTEGLFTSAVTMAELVRGAQKSDRAPALMEAVDRLLRALDGILGFDEAGARLCGRLAATLERQGKPLPFADLQIAAIALQAGFTLVTHNARHFVRVPGLPVDDWL